MADCKGAEKFIIRTSDRTQFKRCRQMWDFGSKIRMNYEPAVLPKPLEFGTAIHAALEMYYEPKYWRDDRAVVEGLTLAKFNEVVKEQRAYYLQLQGQETITNLEVQEDFDERLELGRSMLQNYFPWARENDKFTPVRVEIEFEVPILVPDKRISIASPWPTDPSHPGDRYVIPDNPSVISRDGQLWLFCRPCNEFHPVVYQGRVDLLAQDKDGWYWIIDHKTAAQFATEMGWLQLDEQCLSYAWALRQMLGLRISGVLYNELRKAAPKPPKELVNGGFSKNRQQDTSYEVYLRTLREAGLDEDAIRAQYGDFLDFLKTAPKQWFRRTVAPYNDKMLQIQGERIFLEAIDMLNDPSIYPTPTRINCQGCRFFTPCLLKQEGSDWEWDLKSRFNKRQEQPA